MTTNVKISAHCSEDVEVRVFISDDTGPLETIVLQDGEETEQVVYDYRTVKVMELKKVVK